MKNFNIQMDKQMTVLNKQIGGNHYKNYKIQPISWSLANKINAAEFSILRYLLRYKAKNGIEDLNKAIHYTQILMQQTTVSKNKNAIGSISDFCIKNQIIGYEHSALFALFDHDYIELNTIIKLIITEYE